MWFPSTQLQPFSLAVLGTEPIVLCVQGKCTVTEPPQLLALFEIWALHLRQGLQVSP